MADILEVVANNFPTLGSGDVSLTVTLIFFTAVMAIYALFVYYFYMFLAKKNIIELNLSQYNLYENKTVVKFFAVFFYVIEYIVLLPILTFFWFAVLSVLLLVLAEGITVSVALLISAALVASVRVTAYVSENLSRDLAKMLPFTLLAIAITKPGFFLFSALMSRAAEIPSLFNHIPVYLIFIAAVELIMRLLDMIHNAFSNREGELGTESETE